MKNRGTSVVKRTKLNRRLILVLPNIRSAYNVGSMFRTADAVGVDNIYLCGHTPTPIDTFGRISGPQREIAKTALGAEKDIPYEYVENFSVLAKRLRKENAVLIGLEQHIDALKLEKKTDIAILKKIIRSTTSTSGTSLRPAIALVVGEEVSGMTELEIKYMNHLIEIPMYGNKESLNVSVATGIALYTIKSLI
jgi:23S rRNA (guanosine2251-2'-O)-methyltransferase